MATTSIGSLQIMQRIRSNFRRGYPNSCQAYAGSRQKRNCRTATVHCDIARRIVLSFIIPGEAEAKPRPTAQKPVTRSVGYSIPGSLLRSAPECDPFIAPRNAEFPPKPRWPLLLSSAEPRRSDNGRRGGLWRT